MRSPRALVCEQLDPSLSAEVKVKATNRADLEVPLELLFFGRVTARVTLPKKTFAKRFLLGGIDPGLGLNELRHSRVASMKPRAKRPVGHSHAGSRAMITER